MRRQWVGVAMVASVMLWATTVTAQDYKIFFINFPGADETFAMGMNDAKMFVGWALIPEPEMHDVWYQQAFTAYKGVYKPLTYKGNYIHPQAINNAEKILCVTTDSQGRTLGCVLAKGKLATVRVPNSLYTIPYGLSNKDHIAGAYGRASDGKHVGFLYAKGKYTTIDLPEAFGLVCAGVNSAGKAVCTYTDITGHQHIGTFQGKTFTEIPMVDHCGINLHAINDAGVMGGDYIECETGVEQGFVLKGGHVSVVTFPKRDPSDPYMPDTETSVRGINNHEHLMGWVREGDDPAYMYTRGFHAIPQATAPQVAQK